MPITGPIGLAASTLRRASLGRAAARERWQETASRLGLDGSAKLVEPASHAPNDFPRARWWLKITGYGFAAEGFDRFDYSVEVYDSPFSETALDGLTGAKAHNIWEVGNTAILRAGYAIDAGATTCGAVLGLNPIGNGRVLALGFYKLPDVAKYRFLFQQRNDPRLYLAGT